MHKLRIIRPGDTVYTSLFIDGSCIKAATLQVKHVNGRPYIHPTFGCETLEISVPGTTLFSFNENVTLEHINKLFRKNIQRDWCVPFNHIEVKTQNNESKNEKLNRFGTPDLFCYFIYKNGPMRTRDLLASLQEVREKELPKGCKGLLKKYEDKLFIRSGQVYCLTDVGLANAQHVIDTV